MILKFSFRIKRLTLHCALGTLALYRRKIQLRQIEKEVVTLVHQESSLASSPFDRFRGTHSPFGIVLGLQKSKRWRRKGISNTIYIYLGEKIYCLLFHTWSRIFIVFSRSWNISQRKTSSRCFRKLLVFWDYLSEKADERASFPMAQKYYPQYKC